MTIFLVIDQKFRISPHISPPASRKLLFPPTFQHFPPVLQKFTYFLHAFCVFRFPPTLTMMHLCITQCTYWTPLDLKNVIADLIMGHSPSGLYGSSGYSAERSDSNFKICNPSSPLANSAIMVTLLVGTSMAVNLVWKLGVLWVLKIKQKE